MVWGGGGTWMKQYATGRKVAVLTPDEVAEFD
jgi:hypothetical protein